MSTPTIPDSTSRWWKQPGRNRNQEGASVRKMVFTALLLPLAACTPVAIDTIAYDAASNIAVRRCGEIEYIGLNRITARRTIHYGAMRPPATGGRHGHLQIGMRPMASSTEQDCPIMILNDTPFTHQSYLSWQGSCDYDFDEKVLEQEPLHLALSSAKNNCEVDLGNYIRTVRHYVVPRE